MVGCEAREYLNAGGGCGRMEVWLFDWQGVDIVEYQFFVVGL